MLEFKQAIFPAGEDVSDWVADVKKGLISLYVYFPLWNREWWEMPKYCYYHVEFILEFRPVLFPSMVLMILLAEE
jgi:hypothetical protein